MSSHQDPEKGIPPEKQTELETDQEREIGTRTESTAYQSDNSRNPSHKNDASSNASIAYPDSNHEEADQADIDDLARQKTITEPIKARPSPRRARTKSQPDDITRTSSKSSGGSRLSRITQRSNTPRAKLPPRPLPVSNLAIGIVGWDSQTDPEMPLNFPEPKKWILTGLLASITFISPLASSMFAPGVTFADKEFHNTSLILSSFTVSIFVLGYVVGPLILAPLSEIYGRRYVLTGGNIIFCLWQIGCALAPSLESLIGFRFLAGLGGSGCLTIGAGMIADLFHADRRGLATSLFSLGPLFWTCYWSNRWRFRSTKELAGVGFFWILFIAGTLITIGIEILNVETNPRLLIKRKVARLSKELNRSDLRSVYDPGNSAHHSKSSVLANAMIRPLKMLMFSPIVFILSLYMALVYGLLYLLFTTITTVFTDRYHWAPELCGLAYIGLGLGFFLGLIVVARISDVTVGDVHWIVPIIGLIPFGFGMMGIFIPIQTYVIDSFPAFAASGIAALTVSRSLFGAFLPLAGPAMYEALGYGWGNSVLGFIALALIPAPMIIYKFGGKVRKRFPVRL
ncbi:hypothetical protein DID88_002192 [Monilinia fructigena]|uniref:Major facilitator superfamily (MFS) profile domain-containing protein n=1 Tax=Monilinia fructigena TaxID=38457 RepID=A0A395IVI4_9HELO|nr:hypothetical protein DID88_002192 [Monilinia fructigena]